jgi:long-chain acyl-CoA synthetase
MGSCAEPDRVFHYLPFSFAASWIAMLSFLSRDSTLILSTDLTKLADELKIASPDYFLNVPTLLERVRATIQETIRKRGTFASNVFSKAQDAFARQKSNKTRFTDGLWLALANFAMFPTIRAGVGTNLKGLICGSAPLSVETQLFFTMIGIPVLQVYGLTETAAICTMDVPGRVEPGRVGVAVPGTEMQIGENGEILVRGPHIFPGYWNRPEETANALEGGWFHTGDQGEVDADGYWRLTGRLKNLIVLNSGHKVPPEPLESELAQSLPEAQQIVLVGNQRSFLSALVVGNSGNGFNGTTIQSAIDFVNADLPHYKQVRAFTVISESFTTENGLLTSMGKLKREAIAARFAMEIEEMYRKKTS